MRAMIARWITERKTVVVGRLLMLKSQARMSATPPHRFDLAQARSSVSCTKSSASSRLFTSARE